MTITFLIGSLASLAAYFLESGTVKQKPAFNMGIRQCLNQGNINLGHIGRVINVLPSFLPSCTIGISSNYYQIRHRVLLPLEIMKIYREFPYHPAISTAHGALVHFYVHAAILSKTTDQSSNDAFMGMIFAKKCNFTHQNHRAEYDPKQEAQRRMQRIPYL